MKRLGEIEFDNDFVSTFNGDDSGNLTPRQTPGALYSLAQPTPVPQVQLLAWNDELAAELEIEKPTEQADIDILGGNKTTAAMKPYAACYAGHQFGNWAGQLGDGRAITLGEIITKKSQVWELQLKGAGPTAYSRRADGRAVLRSSIREYLVSEAMHYLRVPTTRALSLVTTGDRIMRDMFYDGNPEYEPGAIVARVSPGFLRFGNFEMLAVRKEKENLEQLVNWTINRFYPHLTGPNRVIDWYKEIVERTAILMTEWQRVGFVHGVMNTDNMSILGLTIDYGPYSFVDDYDPAFTPNTTDLPGRRYAFGRQPAIAKWNLACLAGALMPLFSGKEPLTAALEEYDNHYWTNYYIMMGRKLGLDELREPDIQLFDQVEKMLKTLKPDMTIFYQLLINMPLEATHEEWYQHFAEAWYNEPGEQEKTLFTETMTAYANRIMGNKFSRDESQHRMRMYNPRIILRNYQLHQAIEQIETGDESFFRKLENALKEPYSNWHDDLLTKRPEWADNKAGCSMLSCSS